MAVQTRDTVDEPQPASQGTAAGPPPEPPAPPATGTPEPDRQPLTALVLSPGRAFMYGVYVIALNVALQVFASSPGAQTAFREIVYGLAGPAKGTRLLVGALASAAVVVVGYLLFIAPPLAIASARRIRWRDAFGLRRFRPGRALRLVAAVVVGGLVATIGFGLVLQRFGLTPPNNTVRLVQGFGTGGVAMVLGFVLVGFLAPLAEEIAFRGVIFASFERAWGVGAAAAMSGLLFGIVHLQLLEVVPLGLIGVGLALVFARSRSLWVPVLAHGAYNVVVLALAFSLAGVLR